MRRIIAIFNESPEITEGVGLHKKKLLFWKDCDAVVILNG
jgi:hypothetical protein